MGDVAFNYPKTPEEAARGPHETAHRLYGSGAEGVDKLFGRNLITTAPWPKAGGTKGKPAWDKDAVANAITNPNLAEVDPRNLHASQGSVTRPGVSYYMGDEYRRSGATFADMDKPGNRTPMVYTDCAGRNKLLSGHHRATAALLNGSQFEANVVQEPGC